MLHDLTAWQLRQIGQDRLAGKLATEHLALEDIRLMVAGVAALFEAMASDLPDGLEREADAAAVGFGRTHGMLLLLSEAWARLEGEEPEHPAGPYGGSRLSERRQVAEVWELS
jgi:hypothetical protein